MSNADDLITNRQQGGVVRFLLLSIVVLGFLGVLAAAGGYWWVNKEIARPGPTTEEQVIWIKPGMGVSAIASDLAENNVIASDELFKVAAMIRQAGSQLKAGEYAIPAGSSIDEIIDILIEGKPYLHFLTIPEGLTTAQILALVAKNNVLLDEITLDPQEGDLLPETYGFVRGETKDDFIRRMENAHDELVVSLWESRMEGLPIDTPEQAVILASIVEKETGIGGERPKVAAVFINRLRRGMRLESDVTIIYGLTKGEPLGRGLRQSEIRGETPYNTYVINGLPPTPIANPGKAALAAVLNPADTNDIFFVADGTGGHVFAETLAQHNANVRKWRQIERQRKKK